MGILSGIESEETNNMSFQTPYNMQYVICRQKLATIAKLNTTYPQISPQKSPSPI